MSVTIQERPTPFTPTRTQPSTPQVAPPTPEPESRVPELDPGSRFAIRLATGGMLLMGFLLLLETINGFLLR